MAERVKILREGAHDAEVVGRPTSFQRKLEQLVSNEGGEQTQSLLVRPAVAKVLQLPSAPPETNISPEMRAKAEAAFEKLRSLPKEDQGEYGDSIAQNDAELYEVMAILLDEQAHQLNAKLDASTNARRQRMVQHEQMHGMIEQAEKAVLEDNQIELEHIKQALARPDDAIIEVTEY